MNEIAEIIVSITKAMECAICIRVSTDPVSVGCGHFFCRECIMTVLCRNFRAMCPLCKKSYTKRSIRECTQRKSIGKAALGVINAFNTYSGNKSELHESLKATKNKSSFDDIKEKSTSKAAVEKTAEENQNTVAVSTKSTSKESEKKTECNVANIGSAVTSGSSTLPKKMKTADSNAQSINRGNKSTEQVSLLKQMKLSTHRKDKSIKLSKSKLRKLFKSVKKTDIPENNTNNRSSSITSHFSTNSVANQKECESSDFKMQNKVDLIDLNDIEAKSSEHHENMPLVKESNILNDAEKVLDHYEENVAEISANLLDESVEGVQQNEKECHEHLMDSEQNALALCKSPGWSRIKQMNKDFHLKSLPLLHVLKNQGSASGSKLKRATYRSSNQDLSGASKSTVTSPLPIDGASSSSSSKSLSHSGQDATMNSVEEDIMNPGQEVMMDHDQHAIINPVVEAEMNPDDAVAQIVEPAANILGKKTKISSKKPAEVQPISKIDECSTGTDKLAEPCEMSLLKSIENKYGNFREGHKDDVEMEFFDIISKPVSPAETTVSTSKSPIFQHLSKVHSKPKENSPIPTPKFPSVLSHKKIRRSLQKEMNTSPRRRQYHTDIASSKSLFSPHYLHGRDVNKQRLNFMSPLENPHGSSVITPIELKSKSLKRPSPDFDNCGYPHDLNLAKKRNVSSHKKYSGDITPGGTKLVKKVCLTADEVMFHFNNFESTGEKQVISYFPIPFSDLNLELTVSDQTLNVSILKSREIDDIHATSLCDSLNKSSYRLSDSERRSRRKRNDSMEVVNESLTHAKSVQLGNAINTDKGNDSPSSKASSNDEVTLHGDTSVEIQEVADKQSDITNPIEELMEVTHEIIVNVENPLMSPVKDITREVSKEALDPVDGNESQNLPTEQPISAKKDVISVEENSKSLFSTCSFNEDIPAVTPSINRKDSILQSLDSVDNVASDMCMPLPIPNHKDIIDHSFDIVSNNNPIMSNFEPEVTVEDPPPTGVAENIEVAVTSPAEKDKTTNGLFSFSLSSNQIFDADYDMEMDEDDEESMFSNKMELEEFKRNKLYYEEMLKDCDGYSSDPDMIFASKFTAPLRKIAKEREAEKAARLEQSKLMQKKRFSDPLKDHENPQKSLSKVAVNTNLQSQKLSKKVKKFRRIKQADSSEDSDANDVPTQPFPIKDKPVELPVGVSGIKMNGKSSGNTSLQACESIDGVDDELKMYNKGVHTGMVDKLKQELSEMTSKLRELQDKFANEDEKSDSDDCNSDARELTNGKKKKSSGKKLGKTEYEDIVSDDSEKSTDLFTETIPPTPPNRRRKSKIMQK